MRTLAWPLAIAWAWLISLVLVTLPALIMWAAAPDDAPVALMARAADLWVVAMGVPLVVDAVPISVMPWGFTLVWFTLFFVAVRWAVRFAPQTPWRIWVGILAGGLVITAGLAYGLARVSTFEIAPWAVSMRATTWAAAAVILAVLPTLAAMFRVPPLLRAGMRAMMLVLAALGALAAALLLVSVLRNVGAIVQMWSALEPGVVGGFVLFLLQLGYLPVLLVWAVAYLTGAGIVLGEQATLSPFIATTAPVDLPPLPILAILPTGAPPAMWFLPVVVIVVGWWAVRRARGSQRTSRTDRVIVATVCAIGSASVLASLAALSSGSLGASRLAQVGPTPSVVAWLSFGLLLSGGVLAALPAGPKRPVPVATPPAEGDAASQLPAEDTHA